MSHRHFSQEMTDSAVTTVLKQRLRTEGCVEDDSEVPPPPPLMPREIPQFKAPKFALYSTCSYFPISELPVFDGIEERVSTALSETQHRGNVKLSEARLEALFQTGIVYQARDRESAAKDREVAGFFNARIVNIREMMTGESGTHGKCQPGEEKPSASGVQFDSRFECGNLETVAQVAEGEYNLLLQNDINSRGHVQWFFFKISRTTSGFPIKLNLVNFIKSSSLFSQGMKVSIYSQQSRLLTGTGWTRGGDNISYYRNGIKRKCTNGYTSYYTLSFTYVFQYSDDEVYFAYSCPYTYTRVQRLMGDLELDAGKSQ